MSDIIKSGRLLKFCFSIFVSIAVVVTFIPTIAFADDDDDTDITIDQCGKITIADWSCVEDAPEIWTSDDGSQVEFDGDFYEFPEDEGGLYALVGDTVSFEVYPSYEDADIDVELNGETLYEVDGSQYEFEVTEENELTIDITDISDDDPEPYDSSNDFSDFEDISDEEITNAPELKLGDEARVDTSEKDGFFKFIPEKSGKYVFYSDSVDGENQIDENTDVDPKARVLDKNGNKIAYNDDFNGYNFNVFFDAEKGETYYLQAINYSGDAIFKVGMIKNNINKITYTPLNGNFILYEDIDSEYDEDTDEKKWDLINSNVGDTLTIEYDGGKTTTYMLNGQYFIDVEDSDNILIAEPVFDPNDKFDWSMTEHPVGSKADIEIGYGGFITTAAISFEEKPFKELTINPDSDGIKVELFEDEYSRINWGDTQFVFTKQNNEKLVCVAFDDYFIKPKDTDDDYFLNYYLDEEWEEGEQTLKVNCMGLDVEVDVSVIRKGPHQHDMMKIDEEPATCTESGYSEYWYCKICYNDFLDEEGNHMIDEDDNLVIGALGHDYKADPDTAKAATCTEPGKEADTVCSRCGDVKEKGRAIDALDHDYGEWTELDKDQHQRVCSRDASHIDKENHSWDNGKVTKEPNCTEKGTKTYTCTVCKATKSEELEALGHDYKHVTVAAGLLKDGSEYDECTVCKEKINEKVLKGYAKSYVKSLKVVKGKKSFTVKYKKQSKANQKKFNGYQIRYSTKKDMSVAKTVKAKKSSKSKTIKKLKKKTKYYVQVRTYTVSKGKTYYSKWSSKKSVKTK